jgi:hypothetical protein
MIKKRFEISLYLSLLNRWNAVKNAESNLFCLMFIWKYMVISLHTRLYTSLSRMNKTKSTNNPNALHCISLLAPPLFN